MAKYIEEQEILWRMNNAFDEQDTYLPIHFKELVIDECNPSDVIERSKVDKAKTNIEIMLEQEKQKDGTYTDVGKGIAIALGLINNEIGE